LDTGTPGKESYRLNFTNLVNEARLGTKTDRQIAYAVADITSEKARTGLKFLVGNDDSARIYLNEKEIYRQFYSRGWESDQDQLSEVELQAGLNVLVLKVANQTGGWGGSVRIVDAADKLPACASRWSLMQGSRVPRAFEDRARQRSECLVLVPAEKLIHLHLLALFL